MMNLNNEEINDIELKLRYGSKIESIYKRVIAGNTDLSDPVMFLFYKDKDCNVNVFYLDTNHKAFCRPPKRNIYISDTVCKSSDDEIFRVILHELLHLKYPKYSENEIIHETEKRKPKTLYNVLQERPFRPCK